MARMTIYCVQPFWRAGTKKLAQGQLRQFDDEAKALRAGEVAAQRNAGALVYSVTGDPEWDDWGPPRLLASHGQVPLVQF